MTKQRTGFFLALPAMLAMLFLFAYPLIDNLWFSLNQYNPTISSEMHFVGLSNYLTTSNSQTFQTSLMNTVVFTVGSVALEISLGLLLAILLSKLTTGQKLFTTLIIIPMAIPDVVTSLAWRYIFTPNISILSSLTYYLFGTQILWLANRVYAMFCVILADTWKTTAFAMIILLAGIFSIPREEEEAIKIDGAGGWQEFRLITMPHLVPFILLAITMRTIDAFTKVFAVVYLVTGGGPGMATEVLPLSIYRYALLIWDWGEAGTLSIIAIGVSILFTVFFFTVIRRR
jgi:multiple sugar transport system permease protein